MKEFMQVLQASPLLRGMTAEDIAAVLGCLSAGRKCYAKNEFILRAGDAAHAVGLLLAGSAHIVREDFWGNRNLLAGVLPGELFAEVYACVPGAALGVSVVADAQAEVLFLDVRRLLAPCGDACAFHARLIRNLLAVLAEKNLHLSGKLTHVTQRTTREKLLSYLSAEAARQGSASFCIPWSRQQLADYLAVDRSALSTTLRKMQDEGRLTYKKNRFTLTYRGSGSDCEERRQGK